MYKIKAIAFPLIILFLYSCSEDNIVDPGDFQPGEIVEVTELQTFSAQLLETYLSQLDVPEDIEIIYDVQVLSIEYISTDAFANEINVSGAIMIPKDASESPLLSIQHGTETERSKVASVSPLASVEGTVALLTASNGYVTVVPDYAGFGVSRTLHPYLHAKSLALSVIHFLQASKSYCAENDITLNDQLFIGGYSEGGYATLAVQRELEENYTSQFSITASAPMAGPCDMWGTTKNILGQTYYDSPTYIAFILTAYNDIYQWGELSDIFKAPYAGMMDGLFDGSNSYGYINNTLPAEIRQLLKDDFVDNILDESNTDVMNALKENTLLDWTPQAPIRLYHGDSDATVPYENATTAFQIFSDRGADIELVTIPGGTHSTSGLPAVLGMVEWMNTLRN